MRYGSSLFDLSEVQLIKLNNFYRLRAVASPFFLPKTCNCFCFFLGLRPDVDLYTHNASFTPA